tara:strand:+ start:241 stop:450 length:210 start_codon:yes stop_codon:yes gene_type:complete
MVNTPCPVCRPIVALQKDVTKAITFGLGLTSLDKQCNNDVSTVTVLANHYLYQFQHICGTIGTMNVKKK